MKTSKPIETEWGVALENIAKRLIATGIGFERGESFGNKQLLETRTKEAIDQIRTHTLQTLLSRLNGLKADTYLLGCEKHWSDGSGPCTCDENERTAKRFYAQAIDDCIKVISGILE